MHAGVKQDVKIGDQYWQVGKPCAEKQRVAPPALKAGGHLRSCNY